MADCVDLTEDSPVARKRAHTSDCSQQRSSQKKLCSDTTQHNIKDTPVNTLLAPTDDGDEEVVIIKEEEGEVHFVVCMTDSQEGSCSAGALLQVANRDFPHARPDCAVHVFSREPSQNNASCCSMVRSVLRGQTPLNFGSLILPHHSNSSDRSLAKTDCTRDAAPSTLLSNELHLLRSAIATFATVKHCTASTGAQVRCLGALAVAALASSYIGITPSIFYG
jgi:hypothetical protein